MVFLALQIACHRASRQLAGHALRTLGYATSADPPAFCFDIDGVLIRGRRVLPEARRAVRKLVGSGGAWRYATCFLTNGGGVTEAKKAQQLSEWLDVPVSPDQVILSHTPMRQLVATFGASPVLLSGRGDVLSIAHGYGFQHAVHTRELGRSMPEATPFSQYPTSQGEQDATQLTSALGPLGSDQAPFRAIMVFTDPDDWYRDAQLICDVLTGDGVATRLARDQGSTLMPKLFFSNPDLLWANEFPKNRFGQGAFAVMLLALYEQLTGRPLQASRFQYFGKPNGVVYRLAEQLLVEQLQRIQGGSTDVLEGGARGRLPFSAIYAVGDNPAADVRGANGAGDPWVSCLVRTGVFKGPGANCPIDSAHMVVDNVEHAVDAALHRARSLKWHALR